MKPEYVEGPEAKENFERMATAVFKAPKIDGRDKQNAEPEKPSKPRKKKRADKD